MNRPRTVRASWLAVILIFFGAGGTSGRAGTNEE